MKHTTKRNRYELMAELRRLKAAVATIHDLLHRGDVDGAHEACECAMSGDAVSQPSLSVTATAGLQDFAHQFNELAKRTGKMAAAVVIVPIQGDSTRASVQLCGHVETCRVVETALRGRSSLYMGDHGKQGG